MESIKLQSVSTIHGPALVDLQARLPGKVILPEHPAYDEARRIWNGYIDRYPAVIVRCQDARDVAQAIQFARQQDLEIAVRGGGHSFPGYSAVDGGLVIDLSSMKDIRVDPQRQTARVSAGVKLGELIQATERHGLVTPVGTASDTGIAGLTLGGGFGYLAGKYGLTCDNVLSYSMVTADGRLVNASAAENADLYWGLRGGGGNFGVVTTFEFRLHPQQGVLGGNLIYPMGKAGEVLRYYRDFCEQTPDEMTVYAGVFSSSEGDPLISLTPCYSGDLQTGERLLAPLRRFGPPLADQIQPMTYLEMVCLMDEGFPTARNYYDKGCMLPEFTDAAIEVTIEGGRSRTSPLSAVAIQHSHGAAMRVPVEATAYAARRSPCGPVIVAAWSEGPAEPHIE